MIKMPFTGECLDLSCCFGSNSLFAGFFLSTLTDTRPGTVPRATSVWTYVLHASAHFSPGGNVGGGSEWESAELQGIGRPPSTLTGRDQSPF